MDAPQIDQERTSLFPVHPAPAMSLGRYRLVFELAAGGMGTVYLGVAEGALGFGKLVAIKRIHPHLARRPDLLAMFVDEARIASMITHPNVCSVLDFGQAHDGSYYLTMDYLLGEPVSRMQRAVARRREELDSRLLPYRAARLVLDAALGLHAAHELTDTSGKPLGVVHRDVSPHNLFVTYDGAVRVVDFGIAKAKDKLHVTRTGLVKGKVAYMSPEQLRGEPVDRRTDVWALGVVLWESVALRRLFRRESYTQTVFAVAEDAIPMLSELCPNVPPELEWVVAKALSRDPEDRYQTAAGLARDLARFVARAPEPVDGTAMADWLRDLFPDGLDRHRARVRAAVNGRTPPPDPQSDSISLPGTIPPVTKEEALKAKELRDGRAQDATIRDARPARWSGFPPRGPSTLELALRIRERRYPAWLIFASLALLVAAAWATASLVPRLSEPDRPELAAPR